MVVDWKQEKIRTNTFTAVIYNFMYAKYPRRYLANVPKTKGLKKTGRDVCREGAKSLSFWTISFFKVCFARKLISKIRKNATISGGSLSFFFKLKN